MVLKQSTGRPKGSSPTQRSAHDSFWPFHVIKRVSFLLSVSRLLWSTHSFHFHFISSLTLSRTAHLLLLFSLMSVSSIVLSSVCFHLYRSRYAIRGLNNFVSFWFCVNAHMHSYKGIHTVTDAQQHLICSILSFYIYNSVPFWLNETCFFHPSYGFVDSWTTQISNDLSQSANVEVAN